MKLRALLDAATLPAAPSLDDGAAGTAARGLEVTTVVLDTASVVPGSLFCCVRGARVDGHELAAEAVAAGAVVVLADHHLDLDPSVVQVLVPDVRAAIGPLASAMHDHPSHSLQLVGITGTNGKTTTAHMVTSIFEAAGMKAATIGTLSGVASGPPTTPDAPDLQARLATMRDEGVTAVAMEVSSHGLAMRRVDGTRFTAAVFTNLTQDHLDLHTSMEEYFAAKARLFDSSFTELAVVNLDDARGRLLRDAAVVNTVGYSLAEAEVLVLASDGSTLRWRGTELRVPLAGRFNVSNALAAATVTAELGVDRAAVAAGIAATPTLAGRFEPVVAGQPFDVVVDYAHTPDGLEQLLLASRELVAPGARLLVVFGAGGDRDPGKRPLMGAAAARLADVVVVTSDNPRSEDPAAIVDEVLAGVPSDVAAAVTVELDRAAAIAFAVGDARPGDLVVIAGKGHETTQTLRDRVIPFEDRDAARSALLAAGYRAGEDHSP